MEKSGGLYDEEIKVRKKIRGWRERQAKKRQQYGDKTRWRGKAPLSPSPVSLVCRFTQGSICSLSVRLSEGIFIYILPSVEVVSVIVDNDGVRLSASTTASLSPSHSPPIPPYPFPHPSSPYPTPADTHSPAFVTSPVRHIWPRESRVSPSPSVL